jgi:hypothetical protein
MTTSHKNEGPLSLERRHLILGLATLPLAACAVKGATAPAAAAAVQPTYWNAIAKKARCRLSST